jgi:hypothetical protein
MTMRAFDRWRALDRNDMRLVLAAALVLSAAAAGLRVAGVQRMLRVAAREPRGRACSAGGIRDRVNALDRAGRYVPGSTCLTKSLALAWMLRRNGVAATVRIGVRARDGFDAHAWVECRGVAVNDVPHRDDYAVLIG